MNVPFKCILWSQVLIISAVLIGSWNCNNESSFWLKFLLNEFKLWSSGATFVSTMLTRINEFGKISPSSTLLPYNVIVLILRNSPSRIFLSSKVKILKLFHISTKLWRTKLFAFFDKEVKIWLWRFDNLA